MEVARVNRLPYLQLVESAGGDLRGAEGDEAERLMRDDLSHFADSGRQFYEVTELSKLGIPTISVKSGDGDEAVILIADNGVGLPRGLDWRQTNTLGLRLVHDLCRQIGGTISLDRSKGVSWQIRFKKEAL